MTDTTYIRRGDIYYVNLGSGSARQGSIQHGIRPCVVCGNNLQNKYSEVIMISPITSSRKKKPIPTHLELKAEECNLKVDSTVLFEQIITIQKSQLLGKVASLSDDIMEKVNDKLKISFGLVPAFA